MLKITKTRQTTAEFIIKEKGIDKLVKTTVINTDKDGVSTVYENLHEPDLYAKNRREMRQNEQDLRTLRYKIEDEVLAELEEEQQESE